MLSIEGTFQNGVVQPDQPVVGRDGQKVLIVFVQEEDDESPVANTAWGDFAQLLADCQVRTGISDLAHQQDHYRHGTPKRED